MRPDLLLAIKDAVDRDPARTVPADRLRERRDLAQGQRRADRTNRTDPAVAIGAERNPPDGGNLVDALFAAAPRVGGRPSVATPSSRSSLRADIPRRALAKDAAASGGSPATSRQLLTATCATSATPVGSPRSRNCYAYSRRSPRTSLLPSLATRLGLNHETVREYIALLEAIFLVRLLPAWRPGIAARETHAPKAYLVDPGSSRTCSAPTPTASPPTTRSPASCSRTSS